MAEDKPRIVVTGPSGWIGQALLAHLAGTTGLANVTTFASHARTIALPTGAPLAIRALDTITPADVDGAHVVHLAYLTKEKAETLGEAAFAATNDAIDDVLLGALAGASPRSLFVASSGAAALAEDGRDPHPYGLAKLRQEARFLEAASRSGVPVIAGRIFNLAGPHINKRGSYAIADFIEQALATRTIRIAATVPVFRSYLHVIDLAKLILAAGERGVGRDRPIDLCGEQVVEMADLAAAVARAVGGGIAIERGPVDATRPSEYLGDAAQTGRLAAELGVTLAPLADQVADTVAWVAQDRARAATASAAPA